MSSIALAHLRQRVAPADRGHAARQRDVDRAGERRRRGEFDLARVERRSIPVSARWRPRQACAARAGVADAMPLSEGVTLPCLRLRN
jgi:hypothetical protein